jgi:dipeptidyl aminopeptidase/acylaminoacyl peptidase
MLRTLFAAAAAAFLLASTPAHAQQLTAAHFAREDAIWSASLSPDGQAVAAIQSVEAGDALVIINWRTRQAQAIQVARRDRDLHLMAVAWKTDSRLIFTVRQRATMHYEGTGSRNRQARSEEFDVVRVFAVNRDGSNVTQMFEGQTNRLAFRDAPIRLIDSLPNDPNNILLGAWSDRGFTLYRADINTGRVQSLEDADWRTNNLIVGADGRAIMRVDALPYRSGWQIHRRAPGERRWTLAHEVRGAENSQNREFNPLAAGPDPGQVYVAARPAGQEFQAIYLYDTATGQLGEPVYRQDGADASLAWIGNDRRLLFGCGQVQRWTCRALDPAMQRHFEALARYFEDRADFWLVSTSTDGQFWMIRAEGPTIPATYYVYDVAGAAVSSIGSTQPQLPRSALAPTRVETYTARDRVALWGYLTTPTAGAGPYPTVVMPHGGPLSRDSWEYDFIVQFLVARGYAVFQPNFRGSEGSGRSFAEAGFGQWGLRMQDDVTDGVRHLIARGVAAQNRICIVGISYGGYAALAGVTLTPDLYRCAVSIAGLSDLPERFEFVRSEAGRRSWVYAAVAQQMGDPDANRDALIAASPRRRIDQITAPVLLIHGELDDIVPAQQSQRMAEALQRAGKTVRHVEIPGVYHPWDGWTTGDAQRLLEETDRFLSEHIGR